MMKKLLFILLLFAFANVDAQVVPILGDATKLYSKKPGGGNEIWIQNRSRTTLGILTNMGDGWGVWKRPFRLNDSSFVIGNDTIRLKGSYGGGGDSYWAANGNHIYNLNSGNVGIGINNPTAVLHLQKSIANITGNNRAAYISATFNATATGQVMSALDIGGTFNNNTVFGNKEWLIRAGNSTLSAPVFTVASNGDLNATGTMASKYGQFTEGSLYLGISGGDGVVVSKSRYAMKNDFRFSVMNTSLNFEYSTLAFSQTDVFFGTGANRAWTTFVGSKNTIFGSSSTDIYPSAKVAIESDNQGFLVPRMTTTRRTAIVSPAEGLEVYDLTLHKKFIWDGSTWRALW